MNMTAALRINNDIGISQYTVSGILLDTDNNLEIPKRLNGKSVNFSKDVGPLDCQNKILKSMRQRLRAEKLMMFS